MDKAIEFGNLAKIENYASAFSQLEDSYIFCKFCENGSSMPHFNAEPIKLNGCLIILMRKGSVDIEINRERVTLSSNSVVMIHPGNVFRTITPPGEAKDAYLLFFNLSFLQNININFSSIPIQPIILKRQKPILKLKDSETDLIYKYFELLHLTNLKKGDLQINKNIASSIIAAMFYQLVQILQKNAEQEEFEESNGVKTLGRRHEYVRDFIKLVQIHFVKERSVSFYADKLYISPKYLSLLVKEATGRSAAKWIDDFVLMEAKNMLRYSGKNIQQVAYALNFPTQSSFGKYFKHLTGMSPTEYQHS